MRRWIWIVLGGALFAFGGAAASSVPAYAIEEGGCGDDGKFICSYEEETKCTLLVLCPLTLHGYFVCCVRSQTDTEYQYWTDEAW